MGKRTLPLGHSHRGLGWLGNDKQKFVTLVRWWDSPVYLRDPWSSARAYSFNLWRPIRERRQCLRGRWRRGPIWYMTACKIRALSLLPCSNPCDIASSVLHWGTEAFFLLLYLLLVFCLINVLFLSYYFLFFLFIFHFASPLLFRTWSCSTLFKLCVCHQCWETVCFGTWPVPWHRLGGYATAWAWVMIFALARQVPEANSQGKLFWGPKPAMQGNCSRRHWC